MKHILFILFSLFALCAHAQVSQQDYGEEAGGGGGFVDPTSITSVTVFDWWSSRDVDGDGSEEGTSEGTLTGTQVDDWVGIINAHTFSRVGSPQLQDNGGGEYAVAGDGNDAFISDDAASVWQFFHSDDVSVFMLFEVNNVNSGVSYVLISTQAGSSTTIGQSVYWSDAGTTDNWDRDIVVINSKVSTDRPIYHVGNTGDEFTTSNTYYAIYIRTDVDNGTVSDRLEVEIDETLKSNTVNSVANAGAAVSQSNPTYTAHLFELGSGSNDFIGSLKELIICEGVISAQEKADMYTWLATR